MADDTPHVSVRRRGIDYSPEGIEIARRLRALQDEEASHRGHHPVPCTLSAERINRDMGGYHETMLRFTFIDAEKNERTLDFDRNTALELLKATVDNYHVFLENE